MMLIFFKKVEILALPQKLYKDVRRESEEWKQFVFSIKKNTPIVFYVTRKKVSIRSSFSCLLRVLGNGHLKERDHLNSWQVAEDTVCSFLTRDSDKVIPAETEYRCS